MSRYRLGAAGLTSALLLMAMPAMAQYRPSDAEVMTPPPPPPPAGAMAASNFRASYGRAGRPAILVMWNRDFSDEVSSNYRSTFNAESETDSRATVARTYDGAEATYSRRSRVSADSGDERQSTGRAALVSESTDFAIEAAFNNALASAGAILIDRNIAMRTTASGRRAGAAPNVQAIETDAAMGRASLLVEVLQTSVEGAPNGIGFRVNVKDLKKARVLASFTTSGQPAPRRAGLVAGPTGFVRAGNPGPAGPDRVGRELANQVMDALSRSVR